MQSVEAALPSQGCSNSNVGCRFVPHFPDGRFRAIHVPADVEAVGADNGISIVTSLRLALGLTSSLQHGQWDKKMHGVPTVFPTLA